jgi:hypothetical protein
MKPNLKAINKKTNKVNEIAILKMMKNLVIICYTPEIAIFSQELANIKSN